jgi:hypothetical protein
MVTAIAKTNCTKNKRCKSVIFLWANILNLQYSHEQLRKSECLDYLPTPAKLSTLTRRAISQSQRSRIFSENNPATATRPIQPPAKKSNLSTSVNQKLLKIFLISSRPMVSRVIHSLHCNNFACATDWSPLVQTQNSGEVMSVLIKYFAADS